MRTFTATDAPLDEIAVDLRDKRDRSLQDHADDFSRPQDREAMAEFIRSMVNQAEAIRSYHESKAMEGALIGVLNAARENGARDLDGATVTITLSDLVATATLNLSKAKFEPFTIDPADFAQVS